MEQFTYLALNIFTILVPFIRSFEPKINFISRWKEWGKAILLVAIPFIAWDIYFTKHGIWSFNPKYITGIQIIDLPLEECLFFITVPYALLFVYEVLNYFVKKGFDQKYFKIFVLLVLFLSTSFIFKFPDKQYTLVAFAVTWLVCFGFLLAKVSFFSNLFFTYLISLLPFAIVNGILTSLPVVLYNPQTNSEIRIGTIPFEDFFYSFSLLFLNVALYEWFKTNNSQHKR